MKILGQSHVRSAWQSWYISRLKSLTGLTNWTLCSQIPNHISITSHKKQTGQKENLINSLFLSNLIYQKSQTPWIMQAIFPCFAVPATRVNPRGRSQFRSFDHHLLQHTSGSMLFLSSYCSPSSFFGTSLTQVLQFLAKISITLFSFWEILVLFSYFLEFFLLHLFGFFYLVFFFFGNFGFCASLRSVFIFFKQFSVFLSW